MIYLTQSLPALYSKIGGDHPEHAVHSLLSNFSTKIFHANSCNITNKFASDMIGRALHRRASFNQGEGTSCNTGMGMSEGSSWGGNTSSGVSHSTGSNGQSSVGTNASSGSSWGGNDGWNRSRGNASSQNTSWGYAESMDHIVEPAAFGSGGLKTGGSANGGIVTAVWYQAARIFAATGTNHFVASSRQ